MNDSKTFQVNPKKSNTAPATPQPPKTIKQPQPDVLAEASENELRYAEENARLEEEIRAAQAVLASMKPNVLPKGTSTYVNWANFFFVIFFLEFFL